MKQLFITTTVLLFTCSACTNQEWCAESTQEIHILGNQVCSLNDSRTTSLLGEGATISFYASQGIEANGETLTYRDGEWKGETVYHWQNEFTTAHVIAYHPALPESAEGLYTKGAQLSDVLIAHQTFPAGSPIFLHFEHLFAQLNLHIEPQLNQRLRQLTVTPQFVIKEINPHQGQLSIQDNTQQLSVTLPHTTSGCYSLLLPPANDQSVTIHIETNDGKALYQILHNLAVRRNHSYTCDVKEKSMTVGINNAEDFIAFTHLINKQPWKNRSLDEFGDIQDGQATYYLNNDIRFTTEDKRNVLPIGTSGFNDVFDGRNHTLYNLAIPKRNPSGLFTEITPQGTVRNLHLADCNTDYQYTNGHVGFLCGKNSGNILNCSITNCQLKLHNNNKAGGIAGYNFGNIVNCIVDGFTLSIGSEKDCTGNMVGGISSVNTDKGQILNCQITNLRKGTGKLSKQYLSSITHLNSGRVSNCISDKISEPFHPFCKDCTHPCDHCYFPAELGHHLTGSEMTESAMKQHAVTAFRNTVTERTHITQALNTWIEQQEMAQATLFHFKHWELRADHAITFEK